MAKTKIILNPSVHRHCHMFPSIKNIQGNIKSLNRKNFVPETNHKVVKVWDLSDEEFRIAVLRKPSEL